MLTPPNLCGIRPGTIIPIDEFMEKHRLKLQKAERGMFKLRGDISKGHVVHRGWGLYYEIDDLDKIIGSMHNVSGDFNQDLYHAFNRKTNEITALFAREGVRYGNRTYLPFSSAVKNRAGKCLESALLCQLGWQKGKLHQADFLVEGSIYQEDNPEVGQHAFNLSKFENKWVIIDVYNPREKKNGKSIPYIEQVYSVHIPKIHPYPTMFPLVVNPDTCGKRIYSIS